jgi:uncharacterized protein (TIGR02271 family)
MHNEERTVPLVEERLGIDKEQVGDGRVEVRSRTETVPTEMAFDLRQDAVQVDRVPIGRFVDDVPPVHTEGDLTIVPVLEERLVIEKKLFLVEEIHLRRKTTFQTQRVEAELRKQNVTVERISEDDQARENDHG